MKSLKGGIIFINESSRLKKADYSLINKIMKKQYICEK